MKFRYYDVEMEIDPNRWVLVNWKLQRSYIVLMPKSEMNKRECEVEKKKERNVIK